MYSRGMQSETEGKGDVRSPLREIRQERRASADNPIRGTRGRGRPRKVRNMSLKVVPDGDKFRIDFYNVMGKVVLQGTKLYSQRRNAIAVARRLKESFFKYPINIETIL